MSTAVKMCGGDCEMNAGSRIVKELACTTSSRRRHSTKVARIIDEKYAAPMLRSFRTQICKIGISLHRRSRSMKKCDEGVNKN
jgi:hypothetical protein